jgi:hypothetical protein
MYNQHFSPSHQHQVNKVRNSSSSNMTNTENLRMSNYPQSPNAVTASPSPNSPSIRIANSSNKQRHQDNPHEVDIQEFEAEADYKEYLMYQRIMQHRNSYNSSSGSAITTTSLIPPTLPLSTPIHPNPTFLNAIMIQRLRDNATERQNSFHHKERTDHLTTTNVDDDDDDDDEDDDDEDDVSSEYYKI